MSTVSTFFPLFPTVSNRDHVSHCVPQCLMAYLSHCIHCHYCFPPCPLCPLCPLCLSFLNVPPYQVCPLFLPLCLLVPNCVPLYPPVYTAPHCVLYFNLYYFFQCVNCSQCVYCVHFLTTSIEINCVYCVPLCLRTVHVPSMLCLLRLLRLLFVQCAWSLCTTVTGAFY